LVSDVEIWKIVAHISFKFYSVAPGTFSTASTPAFRGTPLRRVLCNASLDSRQMSTTADAVGITRKLHRVAAAGNMDLTLLYKFDELLGLGSRAHDAVLGRRFVDV
jgi:hypothetical protein